MIDPSDTAPVHDDQSSEATEETVANHTDRREALRKVGRFSAYVAPAMLAMMSSARADIPNPFGSA